MTITQMQKIQFYKYCINLAEDLYRYSEPTKKSPSISENRRSNLYGAILFLSFALESFINEVGIEYCPEDITAIENITMPDKWYLIPKLQSKKLFNKGKEPYQSIATIYKYRNLFVHFKPKYKDVNSKDYQSMREVTHALVKKLYNNTIKAMKIIRNNFNIPEMEWLEDKKLI